jgi:hypothetical protein
MITYQPSDDIDGSNTFELRPAGVEPWGLAGTNGYRPHKASGQCSTEIEQILRTADQSPTLKVSRAIRSDKDVTGKAAPGPGCRMTV